MMEGRIEGREKLEGGISSRKKFNCVCKSLMDHILEYCMDGNKGGGGVYLMEFPLIYSMYLHY